MRISTIIPTYNRAELIGETLRSVLSQTRPPAEVIVVDDGSSDGTPDIVAEQFGHAVTLIRQKNAGAGAARNAGFARSSGDIVHFQDSDDVSSLNTYAVQARAIEAGADVVYGPWLRTRFEGTRLQPERRVMQRFPVASRRSIDRLVLAGRWVSVFQPCLFRRATIEQAGQYRTDLKPSEDTEMLYRIAVAAKTIVHVPESLLLYRVHPEGQVSMQNPAGRLADFANLWAVLRDHADGRAELDAMTRWQNRASQARAIAALRAVDPENKAAATRISTADRLFDRASVFAERVEARLCMLASGNPMNRNYGAGPLTELHRQEIETLGYRL